MMRAIFDPAETGLPARSVGLGLCGTATFFNRSDHVQFGNGPPISDVSGSHVTFRDPLPCHHWRQEERHDQMGTAEMAWEVRARVELRRQLYARHDRSGPSP